MPELPFNRRELARMATALEERDPAAIAWLTQRSSAPARACIVGLTGPPGAGKSTLAGALASAIRAANRSVAVLAVDPSSPLTGGALLGDRVRMQSHYADPGVFIRSMAARGHAGGLADATRDLVRLMDLAGRDFVLIETVGSGQGEIEVARLAHVTVLVLVPGLGDEVQALKAGIMELAQVIAVNQADRPGAADYSRRLASALSLSPRKAPAIVETVATTGAGVDALLAAIEAMAK